MKPLRKLFSYIGYRGASLLWFAFLDLVFGLSLVFSPPLTGSARVSYQFVLAVGGFKFWGLFWLAVGATCLIQAFGRSDRVAFSAAILLKVIWGSLFLFAWLFGGADRAWVSAVIWYSFAGFVGILSGWPEPRKERELPPWTR